MMWLSRTPLKLKHAMLVLALFALVFSLPSYLGMIWRFIEDTTHYAKGYSESKFQSIVPGMPEEEVIELVGRPLKVDVVRGSTTWDYGPKSLRVAEDGGLYVDSDDPAQFTIVTADDSGTVISTDGSYLKLDGRTFDGKRLVDVKEQLGEPLTVRSRVTGRYLSYAETRVSGSYYIRDVVIDSNGHVSRTTARWYQD
jgi:outer membrane protein assembly factor BamE (lipoprotein component of BamABCDE complex)